MTTRWSRRGFLAASSGTALTRGHTTADASPLTSTWRCATPVSTVTSATTGSSLTLTFGDLSATAGVTQKITVRFLPPSES